MGASDLADHYGVFGLDRSADVTTIKKAYRKLVLQWHPDKHPADRDQAEVKIRQINEAYETLSNPFKRSQYDQQLSAFERKAQGVRLNTAGIKPRMMIPKEFMLSPMGYPSKFVRGGATSVFVQARSDVNFKNEHTAFTDFFREAKFSLWWLPQVNNMCRLRCLAGSSSNYGAGINLNFALSQQIISSEVFLSPAEERESSHLMAVASPDFEGSFRFESAAFPGHYLAYKPPTHLRMVGGVIDASAVVDFALVDFVQMFRFITTEEVVKPAVVKLGGDQGFASLDAIRADLNVAAYFERVLQRPPWTDEDFATYFESRSYEFEYNVEARMVRYRSKQEQLANSLQRAQGPAEVAAAISKSEDRMLELLSMDTYQHVLDTLGLPPSADEGLSAVVNHMDSQKKMLAALPQVCERTNASFKELLSLHARLTKFGGDRLELKIVEKKADAARELGRVVSHQISKNGVDDTITFEVFRSLCEMSLDWKVCGDELAKSVGSLLQGRTVEELLPVMRGLVKAAAGTLAEVLGGAVWELLAGVGPESAVEALEVLATGGQHLDQLPATLCELAQQGAPCAAVAAVVAALGERGLEGDGMRACAPLVTKALRGSLEALPPAIVLRLMVAATKSATLAELALDAIAEAASVILQAFSMDDASKLLLAVAKAKGGAGGAGVANLYSRAAEVVAPKLQDLSVVQLIKIVLAIGRAPACRPLLEAAGAQAAQRLSEIAQSPSHLLLLMQGLLPLGSSHGVVEHMLEFTARACQDATRQESLLGPDRVIDRRRELEAKGQLSADQLAKLAQTLAPTLPGSSAFWEAFGERMAELPKSLTMAGHASLDAAFPGGRGPDFDGKSRMLRKVAAALEAKERGGRDAVDLTTREKAALKQRDYERREEEHKRQMDKEAQAEELARQKERHRALQKRRRSSSGSRSRSRDRKQKDKDRKKQRSRSRSRERDRRRR